MTSQVVDKELVQPTKLIFVASHPIQYYAPLFKAAAADSDFDVEVWFCSRHGLDGSVDREFGKVITWDVPILEGYSHHFLRNYSPFPSIYSFLGSVCLGVIKKLMFTRRATVVVPGWKNLTYILAIVFGFILGHRVVLRSEATQLAEKSKTSLKSRIRRLVTRYFLLPCVDRFLAVGYQNRQFYLKNGVHPDRIRFSPYCVENDRFRQMSEQLQATKKSLRIELGLSANKTVFLFCGKLIPIKRPLDMASAFLQLPSASSELLIVGEGELKGQMESTLASMKQFVHFAGFINQSQIAKYYAVADVLVLCSESETWGLVVNEAMNFGIPAIVSHTVGCAYDLIKDDLTGKVFEKGNVQQLSECLQGYCELSEERWKVIRNACLEQVKEYSIRNALDGIRDESSSSSLGSVE